jgi:hypothetical protein
MKSSDDGESRDGHAMIAELAQRHLSPTAQAAFPVR